MQIVMDASKNTAVEISEKLPQTLFKVDLKTAKEISQIEEESKREQRL